MMKLLDDYLPFVFMAIFICAMVYLGITGH
jgi:hypothetical protein